MDPNNPTPVANQEHGSSVGAVIGAIVVLALIVFGALYFMKDKGSVPEADQQLNAQNSSDATADIEADLNATDVDSVDYDLNEENFNAS